MHLKHTIPLQLHLYTVATLNPAPHSEKNKRDLQAKPCFSLSSLPLETSHFSQTQNKNGKRKKKRKKYRFQIPCACRQSYGPVYQGNTLHCSPNNSGERDFKQSLDTMVIPRQPYNKSIIIKYAHVTHLIPEK